MRRAKTTFRPDDDDRFGKAMRMIARADAVWSTNGAPARQVEGRGERLVRPGRGRRLRNTRDANGIEIQHVAADRLDPPRQVSFARRSIVAVKSAVAALSR